MDRVIMTLYNYVKRNYVIGGFYVLHIYVLSSLVAQNLKMTLSHNYKSSELIKLKTYCTI